MKDEMKEILDRLSNRNQATLITGLRQCQLKNIEHPFITKEEYIDKVLDYITNLEQKLNFMIDKNDEKQDKIDKTNWWLKEMLKQAKSEEAKAIINGTLELLLNGGDE